MSSRTVKLLHVEDNVADRLLTARLLGTMKEFTFNIVRAATEITAVSELNKGGIEFVILDYKLPLGDGLGCLRKLRQIDAAVPIIVLSGMTTPEISAELMQAGSDDYLSKQDLTGDKLATSVRRALGRATSRPLLLDQLLPICQAFINGLPPEFFKALDTFEATLRAAEGDRDQLTVLFETIAGQLGQDKQAAKQAAAQMIRPIQLELQERLTRNPPPSKPK